MNALGTMSILTLYHHRGYFGVGWKWFLDCKKTSTTLLNALLEIGPFEKNMTNFENLKQTKLFFLLKKCTDSFYSEFDYCEWTKGTSMWKKWFMKINQWCEKK